MVFSGGDMLSDVDILLAITNEQIRIDPFVASQLGPNSYDVRLGQWFYRQSSIAFAGRHIVYPDTQHMWASAPTLLDGAGGGSVLWLDPGETVLAHTQEIIGTFIDVVATMSAKSTAGRSCIEVCKCAGFGDVGFHSRWTMEITNNSTKQAVGIPFGERIAQMVFYRTENAPSITYAQTGRYALESPKLWCPEDMLPKAKARHDSSIPI